MRRWRLNSGYCGTTDQRRTQAGTIPMLKHNMERNLGVFFSGLDDDAQAYITAVQAADTQDLESSVILAINDFVVGCKADGIWNAIKSSCILAGARTLTGALIPLKGTAPTNFNFVSGDYNRKTGLLGNGSTKYLNSNRGNNADSQDSKHIAVYASTRNTEESAKMYCGSVQGVASTGDSQIFSGASANKISSRLNIDATLTTTGNLHSANGLFGASRNNSSNYIVRGSSIDETIVRVSNTPNSLSIFVFNRNLQGAPDLYSNARLAFYSIGESLNLALLDARVTTLINAYAAAIV